MAQATLCSAQRKSYNSHDVAQQSTPVQRSHGDSPTWQRTSSRSLSEEGHSVLFSDSRMPHALPHPLLQATDGSRYTEDGGHRY